MAQPASNYDICSDNNALDMEAILFNTEFEECHDRRTFLSQHSSFDRFKIEMIENRTRLPIPYS